MGAWEEGSCFEAGLALAGWFSVCFFFFFLALAFLGFLPDWRGVRRSPLVRAAGEGVMDRSAACALGGSKAGSSAFWVASHWAYKSLLLWPSEALVSGVKDTDFRFVGAGVEGGGEDIEGRASSDGATFRAAASWDVSPFWVLEGAVGFRCDVLVFFKGLVDAESDIVEVPSVTVSLVCLRFFFSLIASFFGSVWRVELASSLAYLSFRPSFFQAGI